MKKLLGSILLTFAALGVLAQDRGIGLRIGDPSGITYKKYLPRNKAVELGIGTATMGWHEQYYRNAFRDLDKFGGFEYNSHRVQSTVYIQGRYQLHYNIPIEGMIGRLDWYWGIGGLLKIAKVEYRYRDINNDDHSEVSTDPDFGPEGMLGMEYTFEDVPLTVFGEISLMIEIADRPGIPRGFSGVGVRYNF